MKEVIFADGRTSIVDADCVLIPQGEVLMIKNASEGNKVVARYSTSLVRDVRDYKATPVKLLAVKLYTACSDVPHGSKKLAEMAGIEYSDLVLTILKKLRDAGKVVFSEGKWSRA